MSGTSRYSDEDKARVLAVYAGNGGNLLRTSKETGVSRNTIRHWLEHSPPSEEALATASKEFVDKAENIRNMSLDLLEAYVREAQVKPRELITIIGVLDDKVVRASGLPTSRTENINTLPAREDLQHALEGAIGKMIQDAERRDAEIVDAEYVVVADQPRALPSPPEQG